MCRIFLLSLLSIGILESCGLGLKPQLDTLEGSEPAKLDGGGQPDSTTPPVTPPGPPANADGGAEETRKIPADQDPCEKGKVLCAGKCVESTLMLSECEPQWIEVKPQKELSSSSVFPLFYDAENKQLMLKTKVSMFQFLDGDWVQVASDGPDVFDMKAVYDTQRRKTFFFGDAAGAATSWEWGGSAFTRRADGPDTRNDFSLAFDSSRGRVVMFGGRQGSIDVLDLWEWDNLSWKKIETATLPRGVASASMTYDVARKRVVLFGGFTTRSSNYQSDTWVWDGTSWEKKSPTRIPAGRAGGSMAYDLHRHRVVLFGGGLNPSGVSSDVWEWDGEDWLQKLPAKGPSKRTNANFVYDSERKRFVLHGGESNVTSGRMNDMWELVFP